MTISWIVILATDCSEQFSLSADFLRHGSGVPVCKHESEFIYTTLL